MNDLINRQAAINYIKQQRARRFVACSIEEVMITILEELPSVQQEIIRCKDCKYNDLEEQNSTTRWLPCIDAAWPDDWFCGCAERREDG